MASEDQRIAICITGWHYNEPFYAAISKLTQATPFVISHKPRHAVPAYVFDYIPPEQVFFEPNLGYDWGCYQQFLDKGLWREFDYIFFMHDDVEIKNECFIHTTIECLTQGAKFIGNGRNSSKTNWPITHHCCYAHSRWKPAFRHFQHETIRGSFIATTNSALRTVGNFEVFWDRFHLDIRFGNWSLIATCGKIQSVFGDTAFQFLSNSSLDSLYIRELERGNTERIKRNHNLVRRIVYKCYLAVCDWYMSAYLDSSNNHFKFLLVSLLHPFISLVSK
jgi:hypothetical protein